MKMLLAVMALLVSTNAFAMGFFPALPPAVPLDTPQQKSAALNSAYAISQAEGDAMARNLASDPSWINKVNQPTAVDPNKKFVIPF